MANIKSAKTRIRSNAKKQIINNDYRASMRSAIKNLEKTIHDGDKKESEKNLMVCIKRIDKSLAKGLVHKNFAARQKSRLTKKVNKM